MKDKNKWPIINVYCDGALIHRCPGWKDSPHQPVSVQVTTERAPGERTIYRMEYAGRHYAASGADCENADKLACVAAAKAVIDTFMEHPEPTEVHD